MATRKTPMKKVREIIDLLQVKNSVRGIAKLTSVSRTSVRTVMDWYTKSGYTYDEIKQINNEELDTKIYPTSYKCVNKKWEDFKNRIPYLLRESKKRYANYEVLWLEYIKEYPEGYSYSQFCHHLKTTRALEPESTLPNNHVYGETLYVDFAGDKFIFTGINGVEYALPLFVSILPASRYTYFCFTERETSQDWIYGTNNSLKYMGGVPKGITPDCAKAAVKKADRHSPDANPLYGQFAYHYNTVIVPARPHSPRDKALVENAVNNIYRYVYSRLSRMTLIDREDAESKLKELMEEYNNRTMKDYRISRKELFETHEKATLKPLPERSFEYKTYQAPRLVGNTQHLYIKEDGNYYSVPTRYIGRKIEVFYTNSIVEIFYENERIAVHKRTTQLGFYTTNPEHLNERLKRYFELTESKLCQSAKAIGEYTGILMEQIFKLQAHPMQARKYAFGILSLQKKFGSVRLEKACKKSCTAGVYNMKKVEYILEKGLEGQQETQLMFETISNPNLRYAG